MLTLPHHFRFEEPNDLDTHLEAGQHLNGDRTGHEVAALRLWEDEPLHTYHIRVRGVEETLHHEVMVVGYDLRHDAGDVLVYEFILVELQ